MGQIGVIISDAEVPSVPRCFRGAAGKTMKPKHLFFILLMVLLVSGLDARTRKGDKLLKDGRAAEARGDWDRALALYEQAVDMDPSDLGYLVPMRRARFESGQKHVGAGQKLRTEGKLE